MTSFNLFVILFLGMMAVVSCLPASSPAARIKRDPSPRAVKDLEGAESYYDGWGYGGWGYGGLGYGSWDYGYPYYYYPYYSSYYGGYFPYFASWYW